MKICFKNSITRSWFFLCILEETGDGNVGRCVCLPFYKWIALVLDSELGVQLMSKKDKHICTRCIESGISDILTCMKINKSCAYKKTKAS